MVPGRAKPQVSGYVKLVPAHRPTAVTTLLKPSREQVEHKRSGVLGQALGVRQIRGSPSETGEQRQPCAVTTAWMCRKPFRLRDLPVTVRLRDPPGHRSSCGNPGRRSACGTPGRRSSCGTRSSLLASDVDELSARGERAFVTRGE